MTRNRSSAPNLEIQFVRENNPKNDHVVAQTSEHIAQFYAMISQMPQRFEWSLLSAEQFAEVIKATRESGASQDALVRRWWDDMLNQCQAFSLLTSWRVFDLTRTTVWSLRRGEILSAALSARAALETVANYSWFQSLVRPRFNAVVVSGDKHIILQEIEVELLRTLFASRQNSAEDFYKPLNIVTKIQNITKKMQQTELLPNYELLCEVVHPNMIGSFLYSVEDGEKMIISRDIGHSSKVVLPSVLYAVSWSSATLMLSAAALHQSMKAVLDHFGIGYEGLE